MRTMVLLIRFFWCSSCNDSLYIQLLDQSTKILPAQCGLELYLQDSEELFFINLTCSDSLKTREYWEISTVSPAKIEERINEILKRWSHVDQRN